MSDIERLVREEAEYADLHKNEDYEIPPGTKVTRGHGRTRTLQVRLNADELTKLEGMAEAAELPVSTVARSMLLAQMRTNPSEPAAFIDHVMAELRMLRGRVA